MNLSKEEVAWSDMKYFVNWRENDEFDENEESLNNYVQKVDAWGKSEKMKSFEIYWHTSRSTRSRFS